MIATRTQRGHELIYLLAASHSGSTLLAMLLGSHPEIASVGELKMTALDDPEHYLCSCGTRIRECAFWKQVRDRMQAEGFAFRIDAAGTDVRAGCTPLARKLLQPLHRGPVLECVREAALSLSPRWRTHLAEVQARNHALVRSICEVTGRSLLVDSSKIGIRLKYLLRTPGLNVKVIRIIRDGRGVALTYTDPARFADARDPRLRGGGTGGDRRRERLAIRQAAREWRRSNEEAENILAGMNRGQWAQVRYEDLCADPEETLQGLWDFLKVESCDVTTRFRATEHHVVGNGMRLDSERRIQLDERWRQALTAEDLRVFDEVAGAMNRRYGYR